MKHKYAYAFPRPSVTATIALFIQSTWNSNVEYVILGRRGRKDGAYSGYLCLPGGFLDAKVDEQDIEIVAIGETAGLHFRENEIEAEIAKLIKPGETVEEAAIREVFEETGLKITPDRLELAYVHSGPNTDPRAHVVNICYYVVLKQAEADTAVAGDDLEELLVESVYNVHTHTLAFNHNQLFEKMLEVANKNYPDTEDE